MVWGHCYGRSALLLSCRELLSIAKEDHMRLSLIVSVTVAMARGGCLMAFKGTRLMGERRLH